MITEFYFEDFVFYSGKFLAALAEFLTTTPVFWFVVLGILFFVVKIFKGLVS